MYFIIEGKTAQTHNGEVVKVNGNVCYFTSFVCSRNQNSNSDSKAKRFKTYDDAQRYIDRWLLNRETLYKPVEREGWK